MATKSVQEFNIGTRFIATIMEDGSVKDVSTATVKKITFKKPDGSTAIKDAAFVTDGTDGKIYYDSEAGFLTPSGPWEHQGYVEMTAPRTGKWYSEVKGFIVRKNIVEVP